MPINVYWYDENKHIIRYDFVNIWTREDLLAATETVFAFLDSVNHPVDSIVDMQNSNTSPIRIWLSMAFRDAPFLNSRVHPNHRLMVIVGADTATHVVLNVAASVIPRGLKHLYHTASITDALTTIEQHISSG